MLFWILLSGWIPSLIEVARIGKVLTRFPLTLEQAYRRASGIRGTIDLAQGAGEVDAYAAGVEIPADLKDTLAEKTGQNPSVSWDAALEWILKC